MVLLTESFLHWFAPQEHTIVTDKKKKDNLDGPFNQEININVGDTKQIENNTWARGDMKFIFECSLNSISHE